MKKLSPHVSRRDQVLREWRQIPEDAETLDHTSTPPLAEVLPGVLKTVGLDERWRHNQIHEAWSTLVGPAIARHAQPVSIRRNQLIVHVNHPTWLHELSRHLKPEILKKLQTRFGADAPSDIVFRIG